MRQTSIPNMAASIGVKHLIAGILLALVFAHSAFAIDLKGSVTTADGAPVCALVLASGKSIFSCNPQGSFNLADLATESDGTITLQVYASGFYPNVTSGLSDFNPQQIVMQPAEICDGGGGGGGGPLTNKQLTERMIGRWLFDKTIISVFQDTYSFTGPAVPSSTTAGEYVMIGKDEFGGDVITGYDVELENTTLLDQGIIIDKFYTYNFQSAGSISGCYYQVDLSTGEFSRCFSLQGTRLSATASALSVPLKQVATGQLGIEARLVDEVEALRLAQASLVASSAESTEAVNDRIRAKKAYEHLRATLQAR